MAPRWVARRVYCQVGNSQCGGRTPVRRTRAQGEAYPPTDADDPILRHLSPAGPAWRLPDPGGVPPVLAGALTACYASAGQGSTLRSLVLVRVVSRLPTPGIVHHNRPAVAVALGAAGHACADLAG